MKKVAIIFAIVLGIQISTKAQSNFGEKISEKGAISTTDLAKKMDGKEQVKAKVTGVVESVCKVKGCWMKVKLEDGSSMRVTFKDYGFFVPKDIDGKTVVFEGLAQVKTTSVGQLKHYAQDAGKTQEEIEKITEPEKAITFVANGVIVK